MASLITLPYFQAIDDNGDPLAGGKIYTYAAGTTTPKTTYTDADAGTANANPVVLDASGRANIWGTGAYKLVVKDADDVTIETIDDVTVGSATDKLAATNFLAASNATPTTSPTAAGTDALSIGSGAVTATGTRPVAIGQSYASGTDAVAIGIGSSSSSFGAKASGSVAIGSFALVSSGTSNTAIGGSNPVVTAGNYGVVLGGLTSGISATGAANAVVGGSGNTISGTGTSLAAVVGGAANVASATNAAVIGGSSGLANLTGQVAQAGGAFSATGDAQTSTLVLRKQTTTATPAELFLDGSSSRMVIPTDTTWGFDIMVVGRRTDADNESAFYRFEGAIDNNAGTTALVAAVVEATPIEDTAGWACAVTADNTNDALIITVTGENSKTINWVAYVRLVQVTG